MANHEVTDGETVPQLADEGGFADYQVIWSHPNNADLKKRRDPCVLGPGDQLFVPDKKPPRFSLSTGKEHAFVVKRQKLSLIFVLQTFSGGPRGGISGTLTCDGKPFKVVADGDGRVEQDIPPTTDFAELTIDAAPPPTSAGADEDDDGADAPSGDTDQDGGKIAMLVGHLDPLDRLSGWRGRLVNLGYPVDTPDGAEAASEDAGADDAAAEEALRLAVEEFQCDNDLTVTGERDDATKAKLLEQHGS